MNPEEENPFTITLYDKDYVRQGWLGDPESLVVSPVFNGIGDATITVGAANAKLPLLMERGARVVIEYQDDEYLIGGKIRAKSGRGPALDGTLTFTVVDDWRLFHRVLGWPKPSALVTAQNVEYHTLRGPAETVLKTAVTANLSRLGEPVTVAPDLGRGANITASFRFHPLADILFPAVETAGLGVTVRQVGAGLVVDCFEPELHPRLLTEAGGTVVEWNWTQQETEATDVIVGGQGEGVARTFALYKDAARAAAIGERIEVFRDARDSGEGDVYAERATETFAETAQKSGLSVRLAETSVFRYGGPGGVHVGDQVQLEVGAGLTITDTLRAVSVGWTRENGLEVTPAVGEITDNPDQQFAQAIAAAAAGVRDLRRK